MKALHYWFSRRRGLLKAFTTLIVLINLVAPFQPRVTLAAGNSCKASGPASAAYSVTVCITSPADGATVSGLTNILATVTVTGTNPGVQKLVFYLGGVYLITDYQSPYTFALPTTKWVDGNWLLAVEALMKDGFTSQRASITLNFKNGITQPPVNTKKFTPTSGTTPRAGQSFVAVAVGDGGSGESNESDVTNLIASWNPNLFLYVGDVYEEGTSTEFQNWYGASSTFFGRFRSITDPVVGNHEYLSGSTAPGYFDFWDNIPRYYSYDAAGWHFIALDSNCGTAGICNPGQPEYQWVLNDLTTHSNVCTIAYFHHPTYNVGSEGYATQMNAIWSLLAQYGVDIVLNGHDHDYQRWKALNGSGVVSATGITEFVAGGGGHGIQKFITTDSRLAVGFDTSPTTFGALRLQLNSQGAGYQYINTAGTLLDSGSVQCSGTPADTTAPSKPTNLSATADGSRLVQLAWTASTDNVGVTGYSIYRNGALLTTTGPMPSYDDTTVLPGTSYTYQVRARDAAGNTSSLSTSVSVTTPLLLFSDGFESGDFSQWTSVSGLTVQQQQVYAGLYAARATSSGTATYAYEQLSRTQNELYYRLWFKIISQGANSVYLQRFRTGSGGGILGVFVSSTGKLAYRNDVTAATTTSATVVTSGTWHELQTHVLIKGASGIAEVWLDGIKITSLSKTQNLGTTAIGRIQLGENSTARTYDVALDRVAFNTQFIDSATPPEGTLTPTSTSTAGPSPTSTLAATPTASATSSSGGALTFAPAADAYVSQASPATNYGTATTLQSDGGTTAALTTYIRFTTSGISGSVQNAKLRVFCTTNGTANGPPVYLANSSWTESGTGGVTWNTKPALLSGAFDNKGAIGTNSWVEYDVTSLVTTNGTYTFALVADSTDGVVFSSREGATPSQLVVTLGTSTPPATPTATRTPTPAATSLATSTATRTPTPTVTTTSTSATFLPVADSYVNAGSPTTNYGTSTTLHVDASPVVNSYLRFSVQGLSGTITRVTLRVFANSSSSSGVVASGVSDNTWTEATINYNNAPPIGPALGSSGSFGTGVWVSIDITPYVSGNGTYNLALTTAGSTAVSLASRESGANAPQLIVQTSP
jgi:Big-like domain-containing protein/calcineurin-like phosphoesterase family protein/fibronectin type III domain protein